MPSLAVIPPTTFPADAAAQLASASAERTGPLWAGPSGEGDNGGITQSGVQSYLGCRERFRVKFMLGLRPVDGWSKATGFGNMWHVCEEHHAANRDWLQPLMNHVEEQMQLYPMQRQEIAKWCGVCVVQFPEYVKFWGNHPDVLDRRPLMQERVFDVPYKLPTGRVVRLRGKFDSVDLIESAGGVYIQENKSKSVIDVVKLRRQLTFDIQTMLYEIALEGVAKQTPVSDNDPIWMLSKFRICGVRYNVVRRDCPIQQHKQKVKRGKHGRKTMPDEPDTITPAETTEHFLARLRDDYIAAEPQEWFCRIISRVSQHDIDTFKRQCLEPVLENVLDDYEWWEWCLESDRGSWDHWDTLTRANVFPEHAQRHFRFPFGCYNTLNEGGHTDYDDYLDTGIESGLRRVDKLFTEL